MKRLFRWCLGATLLCAFPGVHAEAGLVHGISLVDPSLTGPDLGAGDSCVSDISADGRYVVFVSRSPNLVDGIGSAGFLDVYMRDRLEGTTQLVSVNRQGNSGGNGRSTAPRISTDGRFVVFESEAEDLVWEDGNEAKDVFLRDMVEGRTELISLNRQGTGAGNGASWWPIMTPDGAHVAFVSAADDLVPGDHNGIHDVFVRDVAAQRTRWASSGAVTPFPDPMIGSEFPVLSADGSRVAFASRAEGLVPGVRTMVWTLYLRDLESEITTWLGMDVEALTGLSDVRCYNPVMSEDGTWIAFKLESSPGQVLRHHVPSQTTELVAANAVVGSFLIEDATGRVMTPDGRIVVYAGRDTIQEPSQIYLWDALSGETTLVSVNDAGTAPANGVSDMPQVSADGRFVWFLSHATDLVSEEVDGLSKLYVRDMHAGTTALLSRGSDGEPGMHDWVWPLLSADGEQIAFDVADDLYVEGDHNRFFDVFGLSSEKDVVDLLSAGLPGTRSVTGAGHADMNIGSVSADGRFVAFFSYADNLVPNDGNGTRDVFVRDLMEGSTVLVSVNHDGTGSGNRASLGGMISADGRYVAFTSLATDLVDDLAIRGENVYVRDLVEGKTLLVSINAQGTGSGDSWAHQPVISADGSHVAFSSSATNLVADPEMSQWSTKLYVRNLHAAVTTLVAHDATVGAPLPYDGLVRLSANAEFIVFNNTGAWMGPRRVNLPTGEMEQFDHMSYTRFSLSPDGRWAVYLKYLNVDGRSLRGVFLRDFDAGSTQMITLNMYGETSDGDATEAEVSADSRWVAFVSMANDLVPNDPHRTPPPVPWDLRQFERDVFLRNVETGVTTLVSRSARYDRSANGPSYQISLSHDGRSLAYRSDATDLVSGPRHAEGNIYVYDRLTGLNTLMSASRVDQPSANGPSSRPILSADGTTVVFKSLADNLIPFDFNEAADLFWAPVNQPGRLTSFVTDISASVADAVTVRWRGSTGATYLIEYRDALTPGEWHALDTVIIIQDGWGSFHDTLPAGTQRYYRVRID